MSSVLDWRGERKVVLLSKFELGISGIKLKLFYIVLGKSKDDNTNVKIKVMVKRQGRDIMSTEEREETAGGDDGNERKRENKKKTEEKLL